jgi:hypothetical protein
MSTVGVLFCFSLAAMTLPRIGSKMMSESYIFFCLYKNNVDIAYAQTMLKFG